MLLGERDREGVLYEEGGILGQLQLDCVKWGERREVPTRGRGRETGANSNIQ